MDNLMADATMLVSIVGQQTVTGPANAAASALSGIESAAGRVTGALGSMAATAAKAALAVGALAATGVAGMMASSISVAQSFEKQISSVGAVSGATAEQLKELSNLALQLGKDTSFSATEAAQGLEELVKAGVSMADIMGGAAAASLNLAAAGAISVKDAAEIAATAMNTFGKSGADMAGIADTIAGAANASAIDVNDFKFSLASVGAVAATIGVSFEDTAVAIAALGQAGIKGSDAGTSLKTMLLNLSPSTKAATKEMQALGIITADGANKFFDAQGKVKPMAQVFGVLADATKNLTQEQKINALQTIFGTDAIRASAIAARLSAGGFEEMAEAMSQVTAEQVANARLDNLAGSLEKLGGVWETVRIKMGQPFLPILKQGVDDLADALDSAEPSISAFAERGATTLAAFIVRLKASTPAMLAAGTVALAFGRNLLTMAQGAIPLVVREFTRLRGLFEASGGTGGILRSVQRLRDGFRDLLPVATSIGRAVADNVVSTFEFLSNRVLPPVLSMLTQTGALIERTLLPAFAATGSVMRGIFGDTLDWLATTVMPPFLSIVRQTSDWFTTVMLPTLPAVAASLRTTLGETVQWLSTDVWPKLTTAATVAWSFISGTILPALPNLARELRTVLGGALEWLATTGWPMVTRGAESIATAFEAVRSRAIPIITALFNGDIKTAIAGASSAFSEFATLATGWLSEQAAKINWVSVWSATKDVLTSAAVWFADAATRFAGWLGEQVAKIDWAAVWGTAKDVALGMAQWFATVGGQIATWIGDQVAGIDWSSVWARATTVAAGMQQWFVSLVNDFATWIGDRVAAIDWASVWARATTVADGMAQWFVGVAQLLTTWIGAEVGKINWTTVWSKTTGMAAAMQAAFTTEAAKIDWQAVIASNNRAGTQMG
jgi:TP901 family phage tail tape measure protein